MAFGICVCWGALKLRGEFRLGLDRPNIYEYHPLHEPEIEIYKILQGQLITDFLHNMARISHTIYNCYEKILLSG